MKLKNIKSANEYFEAFELNDYPKKVILKAINMTPNNWKLRKLLKSITTQQELAKILEPYKNRDWGVVDGTYNHQRTLEEIEMIKLAKEQKFNQFAKALINYGKKYENKMSRPDKFANILIAIGEYTDNTVQEDTIFDYLYLHDPNFFDRFKVLINTHWMNDNDNDKVKKFNKLIKKADPAQW